LEVAQWLLSLGGVNIHSDDELAFVGACGSGHLEVAQWLFSLGGVDIHVGDDEAFRWACDCMPAEGAGRWLIAADPEWAWPADRLRALKTWSRPRDVWMRAVLCNR
jgi:hypothetical protein